MVGGVVVEIEVGELVGVVVGGGVGDDGFVD